MNAQDLALLGDLCIRLRHVFCGLQRLAEIPCAADVTDVTRQLTALEADLGQFTEYVQGAEALHWGTRANGATVRHQPNRWIVPKPIESTDVEPHSRVVRHDLSGRPAVERRRVS